MQLFFECGAVFLTPEGTHGVEDGKDSDAYIGKDGKPHGSKTEGGKEEYSHLNTNGKPYVLTGYREGASGYADGEGYLRGLIIHQHHIGCLNSGIGAKSTHCDTHIGTGQHRGIVDAITNENEIV